MKRSVLMFCIVLLLALPFVSHACVGKVLYIGIPDTPADTLLAEMAATLVTERTGTTVKIVSFKGSRELYAAVRKGEIGLIIEKRDRAFEMLGKPRDNNPKTAQETLKREYQKSLNMVLMEPFGGNPGYSHLLSSETLNSLPALPKLLKKLSGVLTEDVCNRLIKSAKPGENPKKLAREFLKSKRLI